MEDMKAKKAFSSITFMPLFPLSTNLEPLHRLGLIREGILLEGIDRGMRGIQRIFPFYCNHGILDTHGFLNTLVPLLILLERRFTAGKKKNQTDKG